MTIADILDLTFKLIKANWKALGIVTLAFAVPVAVLEATSVALFGTAGDPFADLRNPGRGTDNGPNGFELAGALGAVGLVYVTSIFVAPLKGIIARLVASSYLGRQMTASEAFAGTRKMFLPMIGAGIVIGFAKFGGLILICLIFITYPLFAVAFSAVLPILAVEEASLGDALRRSWALMKPRFWTYMLTLVIGFVVGEFAGFVVGIIPSIAGLVFAWFDLGALRWVADFLASASSNLISIPISAIVATLIYFDARVRYEGFDIQMMAGNTAPGPQQYPPPPPPPPPTHGGGGGEPGPPPHAGPF